MQSSLHACILSTSNPKGQTVAWPHWWFQFFYSLSEALHQSFDIVPMLKWPRSVESTGALCYVQWRFHQSFELRPKRNSLVGRRISHQRRIQCLATTLGQQSAPDFFNAVTEEFRCTLWGNPCFQQGLVQSASFSIPCWKIHHRAGVWFSNSFMFRIFL